MLYVLPGMGMKASKYQGGWRALPDAVFLDWPPYEGEQTLGDVAARLVAECDLQPHDALCGTSLGGMVAQEMARLRPVRRVILVSSAVSFREINPLLRVLSPFTNLPAVKLGILTARLALRPGFHEGDPQFLRAMCRAVGHWQADAELTTPVLRIHGNRDWIIRCPGDCERIVSGGGHLIAITHADECARLVGQILGE